MKNVSVNTPFALKAERKTRKSKHFGSFLETNKGSFSVKLSSRKKSISIAASPLKMLTPNRVKMSRFGRKSCFTHYSIQMEAPNPLDIFKA